MNDNFSDVMQELLYSENKDWQSKFLNELPLSKDWQCLSGDARTMHYATLRNGNLSSWKNYIYLKNDNLRSVMQAI